MRRRTALGFLAGWIAVTFLGPRATAQDPEPPRSWHHQVLVSGYLQHGRRDPRWDDPATNALQRFADLRAGRIKGNSARAQEISRLTLEAIDNGCTDPLVGYLHRRRNGEPRPFTDDPLALADEMSALKYHPVLTSYAYLRAFDNLYPPPRTNNVPGEATYARRQALLRFQEALGLPDFPDSEFDQLGDTLMGLLWNQNLVNEYWPPIESTLSESYRGSADAQFFLGVKSRKFAWTARGNGWADTVSDEGWKLFGERLAVAETGFRNAWHLDPSRADVPPEMIWMCIGRSHPRPEMERWFRRGQAVSEGSYELYNAKATYLMPKWHGSEDEVLEFGRQCLTDTNAVKRARLTIVDIHEELEWYHRPRDPESGKASSKVHLPYYRDPAVWRDIRTAFERFFSEQLDSHGWHHNFALHAWRAQDWKILNAEIPKLGKINYKYFGGQEAFERMLADAKAHEGP